MNTFSRKLPIGIQTFEDIRRDGYLYVDKSALVWKVANLGKPYFMSRPRRFGKSLLISTFEAYFLGRKDLFKGLAIEQMETEWKKHPVLHLDLNAEKYDAPERLNIILNYYVTKWETLFGILREGEQSLSSRFANVIQKGYEQTGKGVVVLIDEYDKPLLQAMLNEPLLSEYRRILKAFYGVLKSSDRYLRFVFITGVTKFSQVSVFSDLNQLNDISLDTAYADICGITREELVHVFTPEITALAAKLKVNFEEAVNQLAMQYDGYHFAKNSPGMFNPFSVLNALQKIDIENYWFQTGTPTFLVELLKQSDYDLRLIMDGVEMKADSFAEYRAEANNPIPLIYQSGYLTIKDYNPRFSLYTLRLPNEEVKYAFLNFLLPFYTRVDDTKKDFYIGKFVEELERGDIQSFMERLKAFFAGIPYELNDSTERHYQVVFFLVFKLLGEYIETEVRSAKGRADAVVKTDDYIYVFEFKLNDTAEVALKQIDDKSYLIPYSKDGRKLIKMGVEFSKEERNINRYLVEEV